jgi:hypothetical protein
MGFQYVVAGAVTFKSAILPELENLNMNGTIFAVDGMKSGTETGKISTGSNFFELADLSKLDVLNLNGIVFATDGMCSLSEKNTEIATAENTFKKAKLTSMKLLNLSEQTFSTNILKSYSKLEVGAYLFSYAEFDFDNFNAFYLNNKITLKATAFYTYETPTTFTVYGLVTKPSWFQLG